MPLYPFFIRSSFYRMLGIQTLLDFFWEILDVNLYRIISPRLPFDRERDRNLYLRIGTVSLRSHLQYQCHLPNISSDDNATYRCMFCKMFEQSGVFACILEFCRNHLYETPFVQR